MGSIVHMEKKEKKLRTNVLDHDALGVVDLALQLRDVVRAGVRVVVLLCFCDYGVGDAIRMYNGGLMRAWCRRGCLHTYTDHGGLQRGREGLVHGEGDGALALLRGVGGREAPLHVLQEEEGQPPL